MKIRKSARVAGGALVGVAMAGGLAACVASNQTSAVAQQSGGEPIARPAPPASRCSGLAGTKVEAGVVEAAERVSAGATLVGGETEGAKVSKDFCRVRVRMNPVPGSDIKVEVWLPDEWNDKLLAMGGAGFDGGLNPGGAASLAKALGQGYAAVATDVGHKPAPSLEPWAHKQPEKVVDFGHRGNHLAAVAAKQVISAYYGDPARYAYFLGCSNGGRDGIMEASRYPEDYDGVIAGAPARRYLEIVTQLVSYSRTAYGPGAPPNLASKLPLVRDAVIAKCDELDGVKDGILENPLRCRFDPAELQCKQGDASTCLNEAEVKAFQKIYGGPRLKSGKQVISGPALGSEGVEGNWNTWIIAALGNLAGQEIYRWMVFDDPSWKVESFDLDRDYPAARARVASTINADDPDLRAFTRRGGKLIIYQGWNDPVVTPVDTINYYDAVRRHTGPAGADQVRLFMVPGMAHCAGGPGATSFDMQPALERWVEHGEAPERIVAEEPKAETPRTHPLCAWPKTASYNGSGSTRDAANFTCTAPRK